MKPVTELNVSLAPNVSLAITSDSITNICVHPWFFYAKKNPRCCFTPGIFVFYLNSPRGSFHTAIELLAGRLDVNQI
ncbi:MAG: hypothetical protein IJU47_05080, partial [Verrucomicrobia bacterium]|nr:hypothetical protein [Verrucomicrobiota bacterium]